MSAKNISNLLAYLVVAAVLVLGVRSTWSDIKHSLPDTHISIPTIPPPSIPRNFLTTK